MITDIDDNAISSVYLDIRLNIYIYTWFTLFIFDRSTGLRLQSLRFTCFCRRDALMGGYGFWSSPMF